MRKNFLSAWAICIAIIMCFSFLAIAGQAQDDVTPTPTLSPDQLIPTATPTAYLQLPAIIATAVADVYAPIQVIEIGPRDYPNGINPLTGLPYLSEEARLRRNLIVKVSNWPPEVRPQHAINQADLVYEVEAEGGVTRFAALFRNHAPEKVGSIRSARLLDLELLNMYAAMLAYSGTSTPVRNIYLAGGNRPLMLTPQLGDNCELAGFCRDETLTTRAYEHTLFGDTRKMWEFAFWRKVNFGYRAVGFTFALRPDPGGTTVLDIYTDWYNRTNARWQYDETSGRYLRYSDGVAHLDAVDNSQLFADNLIMVQAVHRRRPDLFEPGAINESFDVNLAISGPAYVFRDGKFYQGYWKRMGSRRGDALALQHPDGSYIMLKPGRSWITVLRNLDWVEFSRNLTELTAGTTAVDDARG